MTRKSGGKRPIVCPGCGRTIGLIDPPRRVKGIPEKPKINGHNDAPVGGKRCPMSGVEVDRLNGQ